MTTFKQQPQKQLGDSYHQAGENPQQQRQPQQQNPEVSRKPERQQSAQEEQSFTISSDDLMMA